MLPKMLQMALRLYGIDLSEDNNEQAMDNLATKLFSLVRMKCVLPLAAILSYLVRGILRSDHLTFVISAEFDIICYSVGLYLFSRRKQKIIHCLRSLMNIPSCEPKNRDAKKCEKTTVLLCISLIFTTIYFAYGMAYYAIRFESKTSTTSRDIAYNVFCLITFTLYCMVACIGVAVHFALFMQFVLLIYDRLLYIGQMHKFVLKDIKYSVGQIHSQRLIYCKLQQICCSVDSIFNEVVFLWLMKTIVRVCLCAVNLVNGPWTHSRLPSQVIDAFDISIHISLMTSLCVCGGKIDDGKSEVIESLISMGSKFPLDRLDAQNELQFLVNMVGHSRLDLSVGKVFLLSRSIAITILGAIASYCALIYQMAEK